MSQVCELYVDMVRSIWYRLTQIHVDKPHCAAIGPESTQFRKPDPATLLHTSKDVVFGKNDKYFIQSHIKIIFSYKAELLFNRIQNVGIK